MNTPQKKRELPNSVNESKRDTSRWHRINCEPTAVNPEATPVGGGLTRGLVKSLFEQHHGSLVRFLRNKLGSEHEAQDVAQEAFVKLLGLDDQKVVNHHQAYLFRIANNLAIDRLRQKKRHETFHAEVSEDNDKYTSEASVENAVSARQYLNRIKVLLAELPPKCRMALLLYKYENLSYQDIATRMNLTESMVRKYVLRAVRYCAEKLDAEQ